jgi:hypothetical protein
MEYACENVGESSLHFMDVFQCEFAFIKLAFKEDVVDDPVH